MLGAIAGDVIGSVYEHQPLKSKEFPLFSPNSRFTDDTVLTLATAFAILSGTDYGQAYKRFARMYPWAGYGGTFFQWMQSENSEPYNSWGNGSAMRVSPVGFAFDSIEAVLDQARKSAEVTHNHPEGIKGAQATALAVFLARKGNNKKIIHLEITQRFGYDLNRSLDRIRPNYSFDVSCQGTVPEALICFLNPRITRTPFETPLPWAATATPWPALPAAWRRRFIVKFRHPSNSEPSRVCRTSFSMFWPNSSPGL